MLNTTNPNNYEYITDHLEIHILGGIKTNKLETLRITLSVQKPKSYNVLRHGIDLYNDNQVEKLVRKIAERLEIGTSITRRTLQELTKELENYRFLLLEQEQVNIPNKEMTESYGSDHFADAFARIECHYFFHNCWFESNTWILDNAHKLKDIPIFIVHGRYDVVCCVENAWELHKALPESELKIVEDAGHSLSEEGITNWLIDKTDSF